MGRHSSGEHAKAVLQTSDDVTAFAAEVAAQLAEHYRLTVLPPTQLTDEQVAELADKDYNSADPTTTEYKRRLYETTFGDAKTPIDVDANDFRPSSTPA